LIREHSQLPSSRCVWRLREGVISVEDDADVLSLRIQLRVAVVCDVAGYACMDCVVFALHPKSSQHNNTSGLPNQLLMIRLNVPYDTPLQETTTSPAAYTEYSPAQHIHPQSFWRLTASRDRLLLHWLSLELDAMPAFSLRPIALVAVHWALRF
jgi:hypothetical protein